MGGGLAVSDEHPTLAAGYVGVPAEDAHTPQEATERPEWRSPEEPGDWTAVERRFRDGHTETW